MSDPLGFQKLDEEERIYAPEDLPPEQQGRVLADEGAVQLPPDEPPAAAPVASTGTAPSAEMALPGIGPAETREVRPGDPDTDPGVQPDPDDDV